MIIAKISGGLGNQMFQYAFARALALFKATDLALDLSHFNENRALHNGFELARIFDIARREAGKKELRAVLGWRTMGGLYRKAKQRKYFWVRNRNILVEPHYHYWSGAWNVPSNCYMTGYWQSEKYFAPFAKAIRHDFTFCTLLSEANAKIAAEMRERRSISVHIRRGDYVRNPQNVAIHGVCSIDYYHRAIEYVAARYPEPTLYIFSDDMDWAKINLRINFPHRFITGNHGENSHHDMRLMSNCRHHIVANSSFSWWGAWLNPSSDKIVVAPGQWFATPKLSAKDLVPGSWKTL